METYEYLTVTYVHSKDLTTGKRTRHYQIWWPGATEVDERPAAVQPVWLFNELGRKGWKMVASEFLRMAPIVAEGVDDVMHPIRIRWTFVRPGE